MSADGGVQAALARDVQERARFVFPADAQAVAGFVLAEDGPLVAGGFLILDPDGNPIDPRPALRALGRICKDYDRQHPDEFPTSGDGHGYLSWFGITGPLAGWCLAAAEDPT